MGLRKYFVREASRTVGLGFTEQADLSQKLANAHMNRKLVYLQMADLKRRLLRSSEKHKVNLTVLQAKAMKAKNAVNKQINDLQKSIDLSYK